MSDEQMLQLQRMGDPETAWAAVFSEEEQAAFRAALAELAELRKDKARLDWLERHCDGLDCSGCGADDRWWTLIYMDGNREYDARLRAAIDAAMEAK